MTTPRRSLTVTLPIPSGQLGPNGRVHWRKKHELFQQYKHFAYIEMLVTLEQADMERPMWTDRVALNVLWVVKNPTYIPDADNCLSRLKAAIDAGQGVLYENDRQVQIRSIRREVGKVPRVELTFEALDAPQEGAGT